MTAPQEKTPPTLASNSDMSTSSFKKSAKKVSISREEFNEAIEETAIALATSLKDVEMRQLVKAEVNKKFDGDFDVLLNALSEKRLSDGKSFVQKLGKSRADKERRLGKVKTDDVGTLDIVQRIDKVPFFQIGVPYYVIHKWNADTEVPLVVCLPDGIDRGSKMERVKAYDSDGNQHWINVKEYRKNPYPVVVLGMNDRLDVTTGKMNPNLFLQGVQSGLSNSKTNFNAPSTDGSMSLSLAGTRLTIKRLWINSRLATEENFWESFGQSELYFWCENRSSGGNRDIYTDFSDYCAQFYSIWINANAYGIGSVPAWYEVSPNRVVFDDRSRPVNIDMMEYDPGQFLWWDLDPDDQIEHRWYLNGRGSELDYISFSDTEQYYVGKDGMINFTARWE